MSGAVAAAAMLALIVGGAALAPVYARFGVRHRSVPQQPDGHVAGMPVLAENPASAPRRSGRVGAAPYLLGADALGRDVAARLLYGGRTSLLVAGSATALCLLLGLAAGVAAGFLGGAIDAGLSALLDLLWAFPVYLLAISLSIVLVNEGLRLGPLVIGADSLALPVLILGLVFVPYVARPVRAEVIGLLAPRVRGGRGRDRRVAGAHPAPAHPAAGLADAGSGWRPVVAAMTLLTEAALSVLGIGVQPPQASWGTLIADGQSLIYSRPWVAIAPGLAVVITVLALNVLAEDSRVA